MSTFEFMAEAAKEKLVSTMASVKQWPVLAKATSNDDEPTPGYLFDEISTLTWVSNNDCTEVQNYLLKRLEKDAPIVKLKTLRVIKHVILKGHDTFHKDLQRRFQPIKDCTQYRGPSDMLHGDAPFRLVREAASEVMELVYENPASIKRQVPKAIIDQQQQQQMMAANNAAMSAHQHNAPRSSSATSFSSSASSMSSQGSMSSASDKSKMWGYGNPSYVEAPPSMLDKMKDKVTETLTSMADSKPSYPSNYRGNVNNFSQGAQSLPSKNATIDSYAAAKNAKVSYEDGPARKVGQIGGGWDTSSSSTPTSTTSAPSYPISTIPTSREPSYDHSPVVSKPSPLESSGVPDAYRESLLVDSITQQGGVRAAPTRQELSEFCARAKQLNLSVVINLLLEKCTGEGNEKMKSLHALEAMLVDGLPGVEGKLAERSAGLQELATSDPNSGVKTKANKILLLLGVNVNASHSNSSTDHQSTTDGDDSELFAGMSVKDDAPAPQAKASDDLLGAFFQDLQPTRQTQNQSILAQFQAQPVSAAPPQSQPRQQPQQLQQQQQQQPKQAAPQPADSFLFFQDEPVATSAASNQISLLELISQPSPQYQAQPQAQARTQSVDLLSMNDDLLSSSSDNFGSAALHPISAGGPKSSDPFGGLVSDSIPQGKVDLKKVPMNSLPKTGPAMSTQTATTSFSSPFFPTSPGLLNSSSSSSIIAPVARPAAHESKPAFSFMDSKKDSFDFVQEEIRKK